MDINNHRKGERKGISFEEDLSSTRMLSLRFVSLLALYALIAAMVVHGKKTEAPSTVVPSPTPALNETSALETVEKMAIEAKDFVVDSASSLIHKVGELVRQAMETLQELIKSDDNSVTNTTVVQETPATTKKVSKKKSKKSFTTTTTIPEEDEDEE